MSEVLNDLLEGKVTSNEVVNWITGSVSFSTLLLSIPCKINRQIMFNSNESFNMLNYLQYFKTNTQTFI